MKKIKLLLPTITGIIGVTTLAPVLTSCNNQTIYTIHFVTNGALENISDVKVLENEFIPQPKEPIKPGYIFAGWYKDQATKTKFDFYSEKATSEMTLYAKWDLAGTIVTKDEWNSAWNYLVDLNQDLYYSLTQDSDITVNHYGVSAAGLWELDDAQRLTGVIFNGKKHCLTLDDEDVKRQQKASAAIVGEYFHDFFYSAQVMIGESEAEVEYKVDKTTEAIDEMRGIVKLATEEVEGKHPYDLYHQLGGVYTYSHSEQYENPEWGYKEVTVGRMVFDSNKRIQDAYLYSWVGNNNGTSADEIIFNGTFDYIPRPFDLPEGWDENKKTAVFDFGTEKDINVSNPAEVNGFVVTLKPTTAQQYGDSKLRFTFSDKTAGYPNFDDDDLIICINGVYTPFKKADYSEGVWNFGTVLQQGDDVSILFARKLNKDLNVEIWHA